MSEARKRRLVRVLTLVVLLGAILPNVTYIGHWHFRGLGSAQAHPVDDGHANHCHGSSACADQVAYGFQWWNEDSDAMTLDGGLERAQPPEAEASPSDPVTLPLDPPPQHA